MFTFASEIQQENKRINVHKDLNKAHKKNLNNPATKEGVGSDIEMKVQTWHFILAVLKMSLQPSLSWHIYAKWTSSGAQPMPYKLKS